jgi:GAF domain-containing protein
MSPPGERGAAGEGDDGRSDALPAAARAALREIVRRAAIAGHLSPPAGEAVLRSIVEATVDLFGAEAASLALYEPTTNELVFRVAAGSQGQAVVGLSIPPDQGIAGYVFTTGQPLALADVERDTRFGRAAAEQTGYVPRSLVAVPLLDDDGAIGVLEVLDKRDAIAFDLRDVELAAVFARQAAVAIRSSSLDRDVRALVRDALARLAGVGDGTVDEAAIDAIVRDASRDLDGEDGTTWALADEIARLRSADPDEIELVRELLDVLARRAERSADARARRRAR